MSGLPVVYDGVREPSLDIISIPGLPDLIPQYRVKNHNIWLRDVLSHQIPFARIMSFYYDFANPSTSNTSWKDLTDQVVRFLYALTHRREESNQLHRPIVFICYSFGSIILKKALLAAMNDSQFRAIFESTKAILFLGCLHDESHTEFETLSLKCAAIEFRTTTKKASIMETLRKSDDWAAIKEVLENFRGLKPTIDARSFCETKPTVWQVNRLLSSKSDVVCPKSVASLGWPDEQVLAMDLDHVQLSTFPNRADGFFDSFMENLDQITRPYSSSVEFDTMEISRLPSDDSSFVQVNIVPVSKDHQAVLLGQATMFSYKSLRLPCFVITPHKENADFVGREKILEQIHDTLRPDSDLSSKPTERMQRSFAICGLGGMGKTQIAIEYAFRHRKDYRIVIWVQGENQTKMADSFLLALTELGLEVKGADQRRVLRDWLSTTDESWLLIFDNVDSDEKQKLLREFLPNTNRGSVLITSRDSNLLGQFDGVKLSALDSQSAVELLLKLSRFNSARLNNEALAEDVQAANQLVKRIGYLPLGIRQAANLIMNEPCRMTEFLEIYNNEDLIVDSSTIQLVHPSPQSYPHSLMTVWEMNFNRLDQDQKNFLNLMAFCDPDRFQLRLVTKMAHENSDPAWSFIENVKKIHKCKTGLLRSSLVHENAYASLPTSGASTSSLSQYGSSELGMHRLVQALCHIRTDIESRRKTFHLAVDLLKSSWPVPPRYEVHNPSLWPLQQAFLPHVQALCQHWVKSCDEKQPLIPDHEVNWDFPSLLYEAGWFCYERGLLGSVSALLIPAMKYCMQHKSLGGFRLLADIYGGLGSLDTETNQFQAAYSHFQAQWDCILQAISSSEIQRPTIWEVFGLGRLANGLHGLHKYAEAEAFYRKCLKTWEGLPGDQKIFTSHLATCLWLQGRLDEAEELITKIIRDWNDTTVRNGMALFSLGNIQAAQGEKLLKDGKVEDAEKRFEDAFTTHTQALFLFQTVLGKTHHKTADARHKCAWHMHRKRDYVNAKALLEQALETYSTEQVFFKNEIARTSYKLGCVLQDMGELELGRKKILLAERLRHDIVPPEKWAPATSEEDFDKIVQFWTR